MLVFVLFLVHLNFQLLFIYLQTFLFISHCFHTYNFQQKCCLPLRNVDCRTLLTRQLSWRCFKTKSNVTVRFLISHTFLFWFFLFVFYYFSFQLIDLSGWLVLFTVQTIENLENVSYLNILCALYKSIITCNSCSALVCDC